MLCLGPGSACDVCLEPFGNDHKAPCSIDCGHVFCLDCLNHISRSQCPLCRTPFILGNHVKLHVDLDPNNTTRGSPPPPTTTDAAILQEGRRLQDAIASLANQGTSEAGLCQLIADCRSFLSGRSRQEFQELRVSYRMVSYIYEIKSRLRDREHALEPLQASVDSLQAEKAELSDKFSKSETQRKDDKERAFQVEMSLRHHCEQTQASYNELVKMYQQAVARIDKLQSVSNPVHHVPEEWEHRQQLKNFPSLVQIKASPDCSSCDSLSPVDQGFLISPLPEFTSSTLPVHTFSPLPDDDTCNDSKLQPHCLLDSFTPFPDTSDNLLDSRPSPAFGTSSPSLLTMTAPKRVETRTSRSQSFPTASRPNSRPPTCPSSPAPTRPTLLGPTLSSSTADLSGSNSVGIGIPAPRDPDRLRTRLRDLLDTNIPSMSSSLPNLNSSPHVPSSSPAAGAAYLGRGDSRHTPQSRGSPPPPSRSEALSYSNPSLNPAGATNVTPIPASLANPSVLQNPSAPRTMMSHASTAAQQALERVQKEERNKDREQRSRMAEVPPGPPPLTPLSTKPSVDGRPGLQRSSTQMYIQTTAPLPVGADRSRVSPTKEREWTSSTPRDRETAPPLPIKQTTTMTSASSASSVPRESSQQRHHHHPHSHHHPSSTGSIGHSKGKLISSTISPMYA